MAIGTLIGELQDIYNKWKEGQSTRSFAELSRRTGVGYFDTRRTIQGEISPAFKNVAPLLEAMLPSDEVLKFYERHYPSEYDLINKMVAQQTKNQNQSEKMNFLDDEYMQLIADPFYFPVIALLACYGDDGIDQSLIKEQLGNSGMLAVEQLIARGIVKITPKNEVTLTNYSITNNTRHILMMLEQATRLMTSNPKVFACIGFDRVNQSTLKIIFEMIKDTEERILSLLKEKSAKGDIPINWGAMIARVGSYPNSNLSQLKSGEGE